MTQEHILREATFDPNAIRYLVMSSVVGLVLSVVLIPLLIVVVPIVYWYAVRHYARLRVTLTKRELKVRRGIFFREEKAVPLEKITDLAVFDGPIMRSMGIKGIRVETAGQSSGPGAALVRIIGIVDTDDFRDAVLRQRDRIADGGDQREPESRTAPSAVVTDEGVLVVAREIRDVLRRIEDRLPR